MSDQAWVAFWLGLAIGNSVATVLGLIIHTLVWRRRTRVPEEIDFNEVRKLTDGQWARLLAKERRRPRGQVGMVTLPTIALYDLWRYGQREAEPVGRTEEGS